MNMRTSVQRGGRRHPLERIGSVRGTEAEAFMMVRRSKIRSEDGTGAVSPRGLRARPARRDLGTESSDDRRASSTHFRNVNVGRSSLNSRAELEVPHTDSSTRNLCPVGHSHTRLLRSDTSNLQK